MIANINENELRLLAYLHEHVDGVGPHHQYVAGEVGKAINLPAKDMAKAISYLTEWNLIGSRPAGQGPDGVMEYKYVWLGHHGEDYIRALEKEPGIARKLTVGAVAELWSMGKGAIVSIAGQLLGEFAKHYHR